MFYGLDGNARQLNGLPTYRFSFESESGVSEISAEQNVLDKTAKGILD